MQVVYPSRRAPSQSHVKAWRSRKNADRAYVRFTAAQLEAELEGRAPPNKRRRFYPLLLTERADVPTAPQAEPRISTLSLLMLAAAIVIALSAAVKGGFFNWRPIDQAVSTIDYRLAPHLQPIERTVK